MLRTDRHTNRHAKIKILFHYNPFYLINNVYYNIKVILIKASIIDWQYFHVVILIDDTTFANDMFTVKRLRAFSSVNLDIT
jgi:hypothetical protein